MSTSSPYGSIRPLPETLRIRDAPITGVHVLVKVNRYLKTGRSAVFHINFSFVVIFYFTYVIVLVMFS